MNNLLALLWSFIKIGCTGYGGGPSMVPLIKEEVVNLNNWIDTTEFVDMIAIGNALPGPIATKLSAVIGNRVAGLPGAIAASIGIALPSIIALLLLLKFVAHVSKNPHVQSMLKGLRPVVVALLAFTAYDMAPDSLTGALTWVIGVAALALMVFTKIHPALLVVAGALAGVVLRL